jgi:hypothetical protein
MRTNFALRCWLAREVLGKTIRKPPQRATTSRGPKREEKYRTWIRSLPCATCGIEPAGEAAHTGSDGGMQQKASDFSCIPLCRDCHTVGPFAYHRIGKKAFVRRHELDIASLVKRLNACWRGEVKRNCIRDTAGLARSRAALARLYYHIGNLVSIS